jgi:glycolate oxidase FAD binding subunit
MSISTINSLLTPQSVDEVVEIVASYPQVLPVGARTKPALARSPSGCAALTLCGLSGIVEYDPGELTFTALAGTPLAEIGAALARRGQYLPFDPPFVRAGATLGGAIASGLNGPGRLRYGGARDFILGIRFVTGLGEPVRGGGKVVKNAAGFDLPKLFVGSLGRMGVLTEATFKVFPQPPAFATLQFECGEATEALAALDRIRTGSFEIESVEILGDPLALVVRLGGLSAGLAPRLAALERLVALPTKRFEGAEDTAFWRTIELTLPKNPAAVLVKVPLTPPEIPEFDRFLAAAGASRRYGAGGQVAWIIWPGDHATLSGALRDRGLSGLAIAGPGAELLMGVPRGTAFRDQVKAALDPNRRFPEF